CAESFFCRTMSHLASLTYYSFDTLLPIDYGGQNVLIFTLMTIYVNAFLALKAAIARADKPSPCRTLGDAFCCGNVEILQKGVTNVYTKPFRRNLETII